MADVTIYHNPSCSKSRGALEILRERGAKLQVIEYLETPPNRGDLERFLDLLPVEPAELVRRDKRFKKLGLDPAAYETREAVVGLLLEHPDLMQRPVVISGDKAVIARPSDKLLEILQETDA